MSYRIALVGPFPWPSSQGSQAYLAAQARGLAAAGHDVSLFVYGGGVGGAVPGVTLVRGRPGARFQTGGFHWSRALADVGLIRALRHHHRQHPFDLVHAHQVEGPCIARLAGLGVPIVYDLHTSMEEELGQHLRLGPMAAVLGRWVDRAALSASDAGSAISPRAMEIFEAHPLPCRMIGPSVDPAELQAPPNSTARIVYTGNLDPYQDLDLLYSALPLPLPLWIVTGSDQALPDGVHVVRDGGPRAAIEALSGATLAVLPRREVAGFPIKLLNQLGMGVPTVVMRNSGIDAPGTIATHPEALGACIASLLQRPKELRRLGEQGRRWVHSTCTPDARTRALEALYRETFLTSSSLWSRSP